MSDLAAWDWTCLKEAVGADAKVKAFESAVAILTD